MSILNSVHVATHMAMHSARMSAYNASRNHSGGGAVIDSGWEFTIVCIIGIVIALWLCEIINAFIDLADDEYEYKWEFFVDLIPLKQTSFFLFSKISKLK